MVNARSTPHGSQAAELGDSEAKIELGAAPAPSHHRRSGSLAVDKNIQAQASRRGARIAARQASAANKAKLTVFYLGVPDTTPEYAGQRDAEAYLARMLGRK